MYKDQVSQAESEDSPTAKAAQFKAADGLYNDLTDNCIVVF